jgi:hypothetical protein
MAAGDYAPGTTLEPVMVNITFDDQLRIAHCGIGYHLTLPSGRVVDGGFTWHSPGGDYAHGPGGHISDLQAVMDELLRAAADHEGVELAIDSR